MSNETIIVHSVASADVTLPPMFPSHVHVGGASIKLNADGTWEGDAAAFLLAVSKSSQINDGYAMPILWLIANQIRMSLAGQGKSV